MIIMKNIFFTFFFTLLGLTLFAQKPQYESAMKGLLQKLSAANSPEAYLATGNGFERIAANEKGEWLPRYYAAFSFVMQAFATNDKNNIDVMLDKADKFLDEAIALSPKNDELFCLYSLSKSARIGVSPMVRGMKYGPEASEYLTKAREINPHNPRIYYLEGQSKYHTPAMFGGSKDKAKTLYEKSLEEFKTFKPKNDLMPNWGIDLVNKMLETYK